MSVELSSIATLAADKKSGKKSVLSALMKAGMDDKSFADKLKMASQKGDKDGNKALLINLKKELALVSSELKNQKNTVDEHAISSLIHKQMLALTKLTGELKSEKDIKELKDLASSKDEKKLGKLLEKLDQIGLKADIKIEKLEDKDQKAKSDKARSLADKKEQAEVKQTKLEQKIDDKQSKIDEEKARLEELKAKLDAQKSEEAQAQKLRDAKSEAKKEIKPQAENVQKTDNVQKATAQEIKKESKDISEEDAKAEKAKNDQKNAQANINAQTAKREIEIKAPKEEKAPVNEKRYGDELKKEAKEQVLEVVLPKVQTKEIALPQSRHDDKNAQNAKKDEKPLTLQELLSNVEITKPKVDESLNSSHHHDSTKREASKDDNNQNMLAQQAATAIDSQKIEDNLSQKIRDASATLKNFSEELKEKIDDYKPPIMKVTMELKPDNMAPVDVTMITRGNNLIVNINSSDEALKMFMNNSTDFRQNLMNIGFTEMTMNFNFKDQNGEKRQWQHQEQSSKKYKEIEEITSTSTLTGIEITVPRYA